MKTYKVTVIVGSLRKESLNLKLAKSLVLLSNQRLDMHISVISDLPLFNQDLEAEFPVEVLRLKSEIEVSDAVLLVTPEYNRSIPAPLKNAIDWASRPYGENSFSQKPVGLCGASLGSIGTACAQQDLKSILLYLDVILMGQPEVYFQFKDDVIDFDGNIKDDNTKQFLQRFVDTFIDWIEKHSS